MDEASLSEVWRLVNAANAARRQSDASGDAERWLDDHFGTGHTLAVYGTLAPGQLNHHVLAPLGGAWMDGLIEGGRVPVGRRAGGGSGWRGGSGGSGSRWGGARPSVIPGSALGPGGRPWR